MSLYQFLLLLHIAFTAVWFGGSLANSGRLRRGLASGSTGAKIAVSETARSLNISLIFGILTFVTGLFLVLQTGGFATARKGIHIAMGITLLMIVLEGTVIRSTFGKLAGIVRSSDDVSGGVSYVKRLAMFSGIQQLLWLMVLGLMVVKNY